MNSRADVAASSGGEAQESSTRNTPDEDLFPVPRSLMLKCMVALDRLAPGSADWRALVDILHARRA